MRRTQQFLVSMFVLGSSLVSCSKSPPAPAPASEQAMAAPTASPRPTNTESPTMKQLPRPDYRVVRPAATNDILRVAIDTMWNSVDIYGDETTLLRDLAPATPGQRAVFAASWYEAEVNNGGHHQFFFNSTGILWEETLAGLTLLGATAHKSILERAITPFPDHRPSKDRFERQVQLEKVDENVLKNLDDEFYALDSIEAHMLRYIEAHPEDFFR